MRARHHANADHVAYQDALHTMQRWDGETSPLPFLGRALHRLLQEYPWLHSGINRTQQTVLRLLAKQTLDIHALFRAVHRFEDAFYIADLSFWTVLNFLASPPSPAVHLETTPGEHQFLPNGTASITDVGRAILAGTADWVRIHGIDQWIGGVHLTPSTLWRWDDARESLHRFVVDSGEEIDQH